MLLYFTALGCKLNQAEVEALARDAASHRLGVTDDPALADWAVINTCAVTQAAAQKTRQAIRSLHARYPHLKIALIGCYATLNPVELLALPEVQFVLSNLHKEHLLTEILARSETSIKQSPARVPALQARTRALVKIQDGCDNCCSYCIVRVARGAQRSIAPRQVLDSVQRMLDSGYQEVVLTGVHIGAYGRDSAAGSPLPPAAGWNLARLVRDILDRTAVPRLRLSSIEPWDLTEELLALWPHPRLCRHIHLPIQSGADPILERMQRRYTRAYLCDLVAAIRARVPEMAITSDIIAGFPGETEDDHRQTGELVQRLRLARLHVFPYSQRPGTLAASMPEQVPVALVKQRSRELAVLGRQLSNTFSGSYIGGPAEVLFERERNSDGSSLWSGLTDTYLRVYARSKRDLHNRFATVQCTRVVEGGVMAKITPSSGDDCATL